MREKSSPLDATLEQREGCGRIPGMVDRSSLNPDAKALEDAFFARENAKLPGPAARQDREHAAAGGIAVRDGNGG